jgi:hypothetical protein
VRLEVIEALCLEALLQLDHCAAFGC